MCSRELKPEETRTCLPCLGNTRRQLHQIGRLYALLPSMLGRPDGASMGAVMGGHSDEAALPGGAVLAMLGPGAPGGDGRPDDPPAVAHELATWVEDWAEIRGEHPPTSAKVATSVDWLSRRAGWAAGTHDAYDEFACDLRRILGWLEAHTGTSDRAEVGPPCPYCRTSNLLRAFTEHGLADEWECRSCDRDFTYAQYMLALRAQIEDAQKVSESA